MDYAPSLVRDRWLPRFASSTWPRWTLARETADASRRPLETTLDNTRAEILQANGVWTTVDHDAQRITMFMPSDEPNESIIHPYFVASASVAAHWRGALAFHAGAFVVDGQAWGLIGNKGAGKSTFVAALDAAGVPVLADDLLVIEDGEALAGPRFVDLRAGAAEQFPAAEDVGRLGLRRRHRLALGATPESAPFRGWFTLGWGDELVTESVRPDARLAALMPALKVRVAPTAPKDLFALTTLPVIELRRPREFDGLARSVEAIVAAASEAAAST